MCGIFGVFNTDGLNFQELHNISSALSHRGPDDEGFVCFSRAGSSETYAGNDTPSKSKNLDPGLPWLPNTILPDNNPRVDLTFALGHRRLSIVDITSAGHQPMCLKDKNLWITYNGEIYNHIELKAELLSLGFRFYTNSDTEVLLVAYEAWGEKCLEKLNGMWAFAIYDTEKKEVFISRDRYGIKPIYFTVTREGFSFSSEVKGFTQLSDWKPVANKNKLFDFLVMGALNHDHETLYENISQVKPGHYIKISLNSEFDKRDVVQYQWYNLEERVHLEKAKHKKETSSITSLKDLLASSVDYRLRSDTPVGSCLSGGLDSSSIVCLMSKESENTTLSQHTFTALSENKDLDESYYATLVATKTGSHNHTVMPSAVELWDKLDDLINAHDGPIGSTSQFAQYKIFELANKENIKVLLDGQGADEILGGYDAYRGALLAESLRSFQIFDYVKHIINFNRTSNWSFFRLIGYSLVYSSAQLRRIIGQFLKRDRIDKSWLKPDFVKLHKRKLDNSGKSVLAFSLDQVRKSNLPLLLHWEDRNSMRFSVEARVPFLDYRVVEYCLALESDKKIVGGRLKDILRSEMKNVIPEEIYLRKDKLNFSTAEEMWFVQKDPKHFRNHLVDAIEHLGEYVNDSLIRQFDEVIAKKRKYDGRYFRVIATSRWIKNWHVQV
jgi:asparagine synthase (glutamine-hydrolysing)